MRGRRRRWKLLREVAELRIVLELLGPYLRSRFRILAAGMGLTVLLLALRLLQPWPLKWILDELTDPGTQFLRPTEAAVLFLGIAGAAAVVEYAQVMSLVNLGNQILYRFRTDLFRQVLRQSLDFHERKAEGELLTRVVYDTTRLRKAVNQVLTRFFQTLLTFGATIAVLVWVDPPLALVMGLLGVLALALMARGGTKVKKAAKKNRRREGKLAALVAEDLIAIRDVQTFRPDATESDGFQRINTRSLKQESKIRKLSSGMLMNVELLVTVGIAAILLFGAHRVAGGALTAGELVLFVSYAGSLYRPFFRLARQSTRMGAAVAAADRLQRLMAREPTIVDQTGAEAVTRFEGRVAFVGVSAKRGRSRQGRRKWVARDLSFEVPAGQRVAVVGANGAGKSTVLRLLLRLADPRAGTVRIDGRDIREVTVRTLRRRMSVVFQESVLFGLTLRENLSLGRQDASDDVIHHVLEQVRAEDLIRRLPDGLDTVVWRRGGHFSGGELQKLSIARAILADGDLWLLDEPTVGLDLDSVDAVVELLHEVTRGRTTFWVTHDPRLALSLDRILLLRDGRVAFFGDHSDFRRHAVFSREQVPERLLTAT